MAAPATPAGGGDNDLIYRAWVDDKTKEFFDQFDMRIAALQNTTSQGFEKVDDRVRKSGSQIGITAGIVGALTTKLVQMASQAVSSFEQFVKGSIDLRARVDTLGVVLNIVGENAGYSKDELKGFEDGVVKMGITTQAARESLTKMAQSEIDLSKAAELARVSQDAAVIGGTNSSEAFQRILHGITTLQPEILRTIGITVDFQSEFAKAAAANGKSAEQMSQMEKKQIALNAVLKQGQLIAGTYEAAMGSVGKLLTSLPRYYEQIQMEMGGIFQPAYTRIIFEWKEILSGILKFLQDNRDELEALGENLGETIGVLMDAFKDLMALMPDLSTTFQDFLKMMGQTDEQAEHFSKLSTAVDTFNKAFILAKATVAGLFALMEARIKTLAAPLIKLFELLTTSTKDLDQVKTKLKEFGDTLGPLFQPAINVGAKEYLDAYNKSIMDSVGLLDQLNKKTEENATANNRAAIMQQKQTDALEQMATKLKQLKEQLEEQAAAEALQRQRQTIQETLQRQWAQEDAERAHAERIQQIIESAEEQRQNLIKSAEEGRLQVEEDYRKRLQEIQEDFEFDANELVRKRDAVGLLSLIRQNKRQLAKEKESYEDRKKQAEENFKKAMEQIDKSLQEQLKKAEEARQKEIEATQRQYAREQELKNLQNQWAAEDRARETQKALEDLVKQYASMDGVTKEGLNKLLADWGDYFVQLEAIIASYYGAIAAMSPPSYSTPYVQYDDTGNETLHGPGTGARYDTPNVGQAGLVTSLLTPSRTMNASALSNVPTTPTPAVTPGRGVDTKHIIVEVKGNALEPYMQRVLVQGLLEIERNNPNG